MKNADRMVGVLATAATFAYCWAIWWVAGLFSSVVPQSNGSYEASMLSVVLLAPIEGTFWLKVIHWQILAVALLVLALKSSSGSSNSATANTKMHFPMVAHAFYLMSICCLHVVGMLASVVSVDYVIN